MGALSRPEEVVALVKLRVAAGKIRRQIPPQEHWAFAYDMLQKVSAASRSSSSSSDQSSAMP
jgi:farnesyl-diphosphate farnesyltransferase